MDDKERFTSNIFDDDIPFDKYLMYRSSRPITSSSENKLSKLLQKVQNSQFKSPFKPNSSPLFIQHIRESQIEVMKGLIDSPKKSEPKKIPDIAMIPLFTSQMIEEKSFPQPQKDTVPENSNPYCMSVEKNQGDFTNTLDHGKEQEKFLQPITLSMIDKEIQTSEIFSIPEPENIPVLPKAKLSITKTETTHWENILSPPIIELPEKKPLQNSQIIDTSDLISYNDAKLDTKEFELEDTRRNSKIKKTLERAEEKN